MAWKWCRFPRPPWLLKLFLFLNNFFTDKLVNVYAVDGDTRKFRPRMEEVSMWVYDEASTPTARDTLSSLTMRRRQSDW